MASKNVRVLAKRVKKQTPFGSPLTDRQKEAIKKLRAKKSNRA